VILYSDGELNKAKSLTDVNYEPYQSADLRANTTGCSVAV
jgi:hypothetical protein